MAKASTAKKDSKRSEKESRKTGTSVVRARSSSSGEGEKSNGFDASDAFIKLLQSPLVAELVAVAATAALAALAEQGFSTNGSSRRGKAGNAVKAAGKAAAAAVGRRLGTEIDEIRAAATAAKGGAAT